MSLPRGFRWIRGSALIDPPLLPASPNLRKQDHHALSDSLDMALSLSSFDLKHFEVLL